MIVNVPLDRISANPWQTRDSVDPEYIQELANDIAINDLLQEPAGRLMGNVPPDAYRMSEWRQIDSTDGGTAPWVQLAYGHNRLEAYKLLAATGQKWASMPVKLIAFDDEKMADAAWAENEKRRDVTPIERAKAIRQRMASFGWSQDDAALHTGMSRSGVANCLRLLKLPGDVQADVQHGTLSERQATALLPLWDAADEIPAGSPLAHEFRYTINLLVEQARDGDSSGVLRERVAEKVEWLKGKLQPALVVEEPKRAPVTTPDPQPVSIRLGPALYRQAGDPEERPAPSVTFDDIVEGQRRQAEKDEQEEKRAPVTVEFSLKPEAPTPSTTPPASTALSAPAPEPAAVPALAVVPWPASTIVLTITLLPEDGMADGRPAIIGMRVNNGGLAMRMGREAQVQDITQAMLAEAKAAAE